MAAISASLYNQIIDITADYLGPAASRFIDRQIQNHLKKEPAQLKAADIETLAKWSRLALGLLTEDDRLISEFSERLLSLKGKAGHAKN